MEVEMGSGSKGRAGWAIFFLFSPPCTGSGLTYVEDCGLNSPKRRDFSAKKHDVRPEAIAGLLVGKDKDKDIYIYI